MKLINKTIYTAACIVLLAAFGSCRNDWTIKDMPPVPEKADGAGYVEGLDQEGAEVVIPVEMASAGDCRIVVRGRATVDGTAGTGAISAGSSSAALSFPQAYSWSDCEVSLHLEAGVNEVVISGLGGNGNFQVDYIEVK